MFKSTTAICVKRASLCAHCKYAHERKHMQRPERKRQKWNHFWESLGDVFSPWTKVLVMV